MTDTVAEVYERLMKRATEDGFAGWDPFDGLASRLFQVMPLRGFAPARLAWLQMVKRSPVNLRPFLRVSKGVNAKGIALFTLAALSRYRATGSLQHKQQAAELIERLRGLAMEHGSIAFGYNFDWQSRAFFAPKGTPTIVPTAFAARAFIESYRADGNVEHLETARRICDFIVNDLQRPHETDDEICFSYTPLDASLIYNASLLAGETLAAVGAIDSNVEYLMLAEKAARYVIRKQGDRGEWTYGPKLRHAWIDNFHTAFILSSLKRIGERVPEIRVEADVSVSRGFEFWMDNFFREDGAPKYFDKQAYPFDIHSAAAAIVTLVDLADRETRAFTLANKVAAWTLENLYDSDGGFYYQKRRSGTVKIPFVRWGQAWMAFALARLMEARETT